jgi:hypothetical protein
VYSSCPIPRPIPTADLQLMCSDIRPQMHQSPPVVIALAQCNTRRFRLHSTPTHVACFNRPLNAITHSHFCLKLFDKQQISNLHIHSQFCPKSFNLQQMSVRFQSQWECIAVGANFLGASSSLRLRTGLSQHHAGASFRYDENSWRLCFEIVFGQCDINRCTTVKADL